MESVSSSERMRLSEEKARNWLNSVDPQNYDELESVLESLAESSIVDSTDSESGEEQQLGTRTTLNATDLAKSICSEEDEESKYCDIKEMSTYKDFTNWECIQSQFINRLPQTTFSNISISNATNVVMGNVIKIKGDLIVNVKHDNHSKVNINERDSKTATDERTNQPPASEDGQPIFERQHRRPKKTASPQYRPPCLIVPRTSWLAMDPLDDYDPIEEPVDLVIISHTATTSSTVQSQNIGIIRDIQTFHIETRGWDDIGYNFLIGCDGNVYEGRGWGVEGAHTFSYNNRSIGVSFIGCFMRKLPTTRALEACKKLLQRGMDEGHLTPNFKLMGHRQCCSTESPGSKLFQEIKLWEHFHETKDDKLNDSEEDE